MRAPKVGILGALAAMALLAGILVPSSGARAAADSELDVSLPYLQSDQRQLPEGWTPTACPTGRLPNLVSVSCSDGSVTFTAAGYTRGAGVQSVAIALARGSDEQTVTYRVSLQAPQLIAPKAAFYDVPLAQGTPSTIPYSDLTATCEGCGARGPIFGSGSVAPSRAGSVRFSGTGLVLQSSPDFTGRATISYRVDDPFGQRSEATTLRVAVVSGMTHAPTMVASSATGPRGEAILGRVTAKDVVDARYPVTLSACGHPANGTVTCERDGSFVYRPDSGFTGLDQFSYLVFADRSGDQAAGSVVVGVSSDPTPSISALPAAEQAVAIAPAASSQNKNG